jgi:hypothetical protein
MKATRVRGDDVLSIPDDPKKAMVGIQADFKLKDDNIAEPASIQPKKLIQNLHLSTEKSEASTAIDDCKMFDTFHYGKTGRFYKEVIAINQSTLPQPQRITMSVTITPPFVHIRTTEILPMMVSKLALQQTRSL